jgi:putative oxidoreductase
MFRKLLHTDHDWLLTVVRLVLGIVFFAHGAQKVLGWFGGPGLKATLQYFTSAGIPPVFGLLAIAAEFLGPLGLAVGLLTRVAAFGIMCVMLVAMIMVHGRYGFFMNWFGTQSGEGIEYHLLVLGIAIALIVMGAGAGSIDAALLLVTRGSAP